MEQTFCPHCMAPAHGRVCESCGGDLNYTAPEYYLPVGTVLHGSAGQSYCLGKAQGQGGFGITYIARELTTGQRLAVKEYYPVRCARRGTENTVVAMPGQDDTYLGGLRSFLKEARMLASLPALPSIVRVQDFLQENGTAYLVMEYLDGLPLYRVVTQKGRIPLEELKEKLLPFLRDLEWLHRAEVIHRDISPDNIMWMPDGTWKLLDFGCARSMEDGRSMTVLLKHGFAPVEQYQTRGQGPWTDVYALAATIYYCLTGTVPPSSVERLEEDLLQPPSALGALMTPEQEQALLWGLEVQPQQRPASVELFARRLFPEFQLEPPADEGGSGTEKRSRDISGRTMKLALLAAAAIGGLCLLGLVAAALL